MATQFIFQPHIHADGMVITPDLPLVRVLAWSGQAGPFPVPARHLCTDLWVQTAMPGAELRPAYALVAASEGTLVAPAALIAAPGEAEAHAGAEIALSRQAWRLRDTDEVALTLDGEEASGALAPKAAIAAMGGVEGMLPYGHVVICAATGVPVAAGAPAAAGRFVVALDAGARRLSHKIDLVTLAA